ncbi:hypothetical protein FHS61_000048 [Altererythrobacter atlanticus]|nr:hypothetical protein [Croceibacterium atlanticum]MBB5731055.1 hypothetical protein [Croceibacterium atlanticum]
MPIAEDGRIDGDQLSVSNCSTAPCAGRYLHWNICLPRSVAWERE